MILMMFSAFTSQSPDDGNNGRRQFVPPNTSRSPIPIIRVAPNKIRTSIQRHYSDKVILGFERPTSKYRAKEWITAYNEEAPIKLVFQVEIVNTLFVVKIDIVDLKDAKRRLTSGRPLHALDQYAFVNAYLENFDPRNLVDFKHLVTIVINKDSLMIHDHLKAITEPVGTLVKPGIIDSRIEHYRIIALVETTLRLFTPQVQFPLKHSMFTIGFNFDGRNLRCEHYFSYNHIASACPI